MWYGHRDVWRHFAPQALATNVQWDSCNKVELKVVSSNYSPPSTLFYRMAITTLSKFIIILSVASMIFGTCTLRQNKGHAHKKLPEGTQSPGRFLPVTLYTLDMSLLSDISCLDFRCTFSLLSIKESLLKATS